ncbi:MAG: hypothetical protein OK422_00050 [Thaumarchaeota archaeon]|nr:hypothetical protein [Nitrososphaerota archaeon]
MAGARGEGWRGMASEELAMLVQKANIGSNDLVDKAEKQKDLDEIEKGMVPPIWVRIHCSL